MKSSNNRRPVWTITNGKWTCNNPEQTEFERMFAKLEGCVQETQAIIRPILAAGGAAKPQDRMALRDLVFRTMLEKLDMFNRDELHAICTSVFADRIMQDVEDAPRGGPPDLLSGK